jgi:hypothetical protein
MYPRVIQFDTRRHEQLGAALLSARYLMEAS